MIREHIYHLFFKFILSEILSNSLAGSDVLLFSEFMNIDSVLYYGFIKFIKLWYTFLITFFVWHREYMIWRVSFWKFLNVLPAIICASAIGNLWSICLGVNMFNHVLGSDSCLAVNRIAEKSSKN